MFFSQANINRETQAQTTFGEEMWQWLLELYGEVVYLLG
jgi:hypothetical protein